MAKDKQPTAEEIAQARKEMAKIAALNLKNDYILSLAAYTMGSRGGYGNIFSEDFYNQIIAKAPDQSAYDQLIKPALIGQEVALTKESIRNAAVGIFANSIASSEIKDLVSYLGSKKAPKADYAGKYVSDLNEEAVHALVEMSQKKLLRAMSKKAFEMEEKSEISALEKMLCEPDKSEAKKAA